MKYLLSLVIFLSFTVSFAQQNGQITKDVLQDLEKSFKESPADHAILNAVSNNEIDDLAKNRKNVGKIDEYFDYKIEVPGITDQHSTGRCWMFTGMNVLRPKVASSANMKSFEFSPVYLFFYDQLEKSNLFMEGVIATADKPIDDRKVAWFFSSPIGDGGVWSMFADLIQKYGIVPVDAMPETKHSKNTKIMRNFLRKTLRKGGMELRALIADGTDAEKVLEKKVQILGDVYRLLVLHLGEPPKEFSWRYKDKDGTVSAEKTYTPISFYEEMISTDVTDYVLFMDDPTREYNKLYEIEYDRDVMEGNNWKYINLTADKIKEYAIASLKANEPMYFSCDVGEQLDREGGYLSLENYSYEALYGVSFEMSKAERIHSRESGSTHGMSLVGVDLDENRIPVKWLLENSWGKDAGLDGYLIMEDDWFDEYMFRLVIKKEFIDKEALEILDTEPIMLPPWDPMFEYDK